MLSQTGSPVHLRSSAALVSRNSDSSHNSRAGHPGWLRCSSLTYSRYARSSRLAIRAPRSGTYATNHCYGTLAGADRFAQRASRLLHGLHDVLIAGAPAQIAGEALADVGLAGRRVVLQQRVRRQQHAWRAVSALQAMLIPEPLL